MKPADFILDLVYPRYCAFFHKRMGKEEGIFCSSCRRSLPYTKNESIKIPFLKDCRAPLYYEDFVKDSLRRYKFASLNMYDRVYGEIILQRLGDYAACCDIISYVPLSRRRLRSRGYDQARLLCEVIAEKTGRRAERILKKVKNTAPQSLTGGPESRAENIKGAYRAFKPEKFKGKSVLLVDDIVTTGATLSECAALLLQSGAREVKGLAVARSRY